MDFSSSTGSRQVSLFRTGFDGASQGFTFGVFYRALQGCISFHVVKGLCTAATAVYRKPSQAPSASP